MLRSAKGASAILLAALLFCLAIGCGDHVVQPDDTPAALTSGQLIIGPIAGLTTSWYPVEPILEAIREDPQLGLGKREPGLPLPVGVEVMLACTLPEESTISWVGAKPDPENPRLATVRLERAGPALVELTIVSSGATRIMECPVLGVELPQDGLRVSSPGVTAASIAPNESLDNAQTMALFFGSSIARVTRLSDGRYLTGVGAAVNVSVDAHPIEFSPLVEWHLPSGPRIGRSQRVNLDRVGEPTILAGAPGRQLTLQFVTYDVEILGTDLGDHLELEVPLQFRARTIPAGYEEHVSWLASTKYGTARPISGRGEFFTTTFSQPSGPAGIWLGVKADRSYKQHDVTGGPEYVFEVDLSVDESGGSKRATTYSYPRIRAWFKGDADDQIHDIGVRRLTDGDNDGLGLWLRMANLTGCRIQAERLTNDLGPFTTQQTYAPVFDATGCINTSGFPANLSATGAQGIGWLSVDGDPYPQERLITWVSPCPGGAVTWTAEGSISIVSSTGGTCTIRANAVGVGILTGVCRGAGATVRVIHSIQTTG